METRELKTHEKVSVGGEALSKGKVLEGRYRIVSKLGSGGVGDVYLADHLRLNRSVAVKVLQPNFAASKKLRMRFEREAQALANMAHPHIVSINDFGVAVATPYLVMELLQGEPLGLRLKRGAIPAKTAISVARQILLALSFAHKNGWVHRDLKPGNVFLQDLEADTTHVKILDFGLAKMVTADGATKGPRLTLTGMVFGTPAYMAPEQAVGGKTDSRTDLYALGAVLFEMLAGERIFKGAAEQLMRQHLQAPVPSLHELCPERKASAALDAFIRKSLAKERGDRYQTAEEMIEALDELEEPYIIESDAGNVAPIDEEGETELGIVNGVTELQSKNVATVGQTPGRMQPPRKTTSLKSTLLLIGVGLAVGVTISIPITYVAFGDRGSSAPSDVVSLSDGDIELPHHDGGGDSSAVEPSGEGGRIGPWAEEEMPEVVEESLNQLLTGRELSSSMLRGLRRYARRNTDDPRPLILLARHNLLRGARTDAIDRYERAYKANENARHDPRMLSDLLSLSEQRGVGYKALRALERIYGVEALDDVEQRLQSGELDEGAQRRFEKLRATLRALPSRAP